MEKSPARSLALGSASIFFFFLLTLIYAVPLLKDVHFWGQMDWDEFFFWNAVPRETILKHHQFPLWNPYSNGGNVLLALPFTSFLSVPFLVVLMFGPVLGLKVQWLLSLVLGMIGMFHLAKDFKIEGLSRYLPPVVFMFSSLFTLHMAEGHPVWIMMAALPWFFLFLPRARTSKKSFFLSAFLLAQMFLAGAVHILAITVFMAAIYSFCLSLKERQKGYLVSLSGILLYMALLGAVKMIPMVEFLKDSPRKVESPEKLSLSLLPALFLSREQDALYQRTKWSDPMQSLELKDPKVPYGWHEYGAYVGFIPLIAAIIGVFISLRRHFPLLAVGVCCLWISFGAGAFPDLWGLLHRLPFYDSLRAPSRFLIGVLFSLSLFSGIALSKFEGLSHKPRHKLLTAAIIAFVILDLLGVVYPTLRKTFTVTPFGLPAHDVFQQRYVSLDLFPGQSRSSMYPAFLGNSGILEGYEVINVKKGQVKTAGDPSYRGESYLVGTGGDVVTERFSPNEIKVRVETQGEGALVLNQNFYKGWRVRKGGSFGRALPYEGLIATPVSPQVKEAIFYYLPVSFLVGCLLTLASLFAGVPVLLVTRRRAAWGQGPEDRTE